MLFIGIFRRTAFKIICKKHEKGACCQKLTYLWAVQENLSKLRGSCCFIIL